MKRGTWTAAALAIAAAMASLADPTPRGPYALVAENYLLGHDDRARECFAAIDASAADARWLALPSHEELASRLVVGDPIRDADLARIARRLDREGRDAATKALFQTVACARGGRPNEARAFAIRLLEVDPGRRAREVAAWIAQPERFGRPLPDRPGR